MAKKGHLFPPRAGFTGSSGKVQSVRGYTRKVVHKAAGGVIALRNRPVAPPPPSPRLIGYAPPQRPLPAPPRAMSSPKTPPRTQAYAGGGYVTETIGDQGNAAVKRGNPPIVESDKQYGGKSPLNVGYKTGGRAFNRTPKFGK